MALIRYRVTVAAHVVTGRERFAGCGRRWPVPGRESITSAATPAIARWQVLQLVHGDAGVPSMRSLLREGWPHTSAVVELDPNAEKIERMRARDERRRAEGR